MSKELYIAEHERLLSEREEECEALGISFDESAEYDRLGDAAWEAMRNRIGDMADGARQRAKDTTPDPLAFQRERG